MSTNTLSNTVLMKRHDTRPFLDVTLKGTDGNALDLDIDGLTVTFTMKNYDTDIVKIDTQLCTILNASLGLVRYAWAVGDTDTAGTYLGEFEVNYGSSDKMTVPVSEVLAIVILEDYNDQ